MADRSRNLDSRLFVILQFLFLKRYRINAVGQHHGKKIVMHPDFMSILLNLPINQIHCRVTEYFPRFFPAVICSGMKDIIGGSDVPFLLFLRHHHRMKRSHINVMPEIYRYSVRCFFLHEVPARDHMIA